MENQIWDSFRPFEKEEKPYFYRQRPAIDKVSHFIGYFSGFFGSDGKKYFPHWETIQKGFYSEEFSAELDAIVNALRNSDEAGACLKDRATMQKFCASHPEAAITYSSQSENFKEDSFGFRIDTERFSYLLRIRQLKAGNDFCIMCYERSNLDKCIEGTKRIRCHKKRSAAPEQPNDATKAAMLEAERITNDPSAKRYSDAEKALQELKK